MPCLSDSPTDLKVVWVGVGDTKLQIEISLFSMCFGWNPDEGAVGIGGTIREVMGVMHIDRCLGT